MPRRGMGVLCCLSCVVDEERVTMTFDNVQRNRAAIVQHDMFLQPTVCSFACKPVQRCQQGYLLLILLLYWNLFLAIVWVVCVAPAYLLFMFVLAHLPPLPILSVLLAMGWGCR